MTAVDAAPISPLVTVVVLNYNYARYLPDSIGSALAQTHPHTEVVVVDDASTDHSRSVIDAYGTEIIPVLHDENRGQGGAINSGAAAASGDLVWFLDADDTLSPDACAVAAAALTADPAMSKLHAPLTVIDGQGRATGALLPSDSSVLADGDLSTHLIRFRNHGWPPMSGNAYNAHALGRILPVPEEHYREAADSFLNEQAPICGPVARHLTPLASYRVHGENQFAGRPVSLEWLRTKLYREECSHWRLRRLARTVDPTLAVPDSVTEALDVALTGYRLAALRLEPEGHPQLSPKGADRAWPLARHGLRATWAHPSLPVRDRIARSAWFATMAVAPDSVVPAILDAYLPDGPRPPLWAGRRNRRHRTDPTPIPTPTGSKTPT